MSMQDDEQSERRKYYRIEERIALDFTPINDPAQSSEVQSGDALLFNLLTDLHQAEYEAQHLLRQIAERDRALASYLKVINKRIDLLGNALAAKQLSRLGELQQVSLSEGGMNFTHTSAFTCGQYLAMKIVLLPQALGIELCAKVMHCQALGAEQFDIGVEFEGLSESKRQLLARHILQKQALERRLAKDPTAQDH